MTEPFTGWPPVGTTARGWLDRLYWGGDYREPYDTETYYYVPMLDTGALTSPMATFKDPHTDTIAIIHEFATGWRAWRAREGDTLALRQARGSARWRINQDSDEPPSARIVAYVQLNLVRAREGGGGEWRRGWR